MILKGKVAVILAVVSCIAALSTAVAKGYEYITVGGTAEERKVIILDAGHAEQTKPYKTPNGKNNAL